MRKTWLVLFCMMLSIFRGDFIAYSGEIDSKNATGEYVVLLHGIFRSSRHMRKLEQGLVEAGYQVLNLDYPSTEYSLQDLTELICRRIKHRLPENAAKVHFVGYSMGGLLVRAVLNKNRPRNLGRVVLLATPNKGSEVADFLEHFPPYRWLYGPAGLQLVTRQGADVKELLGEVDYAPGVIAGTRTVDPFSSLFLLPGKDDGKVSVESAKIEGMGDFIELPVSHTFFPQNAMVIAQTVHFLQDGKFKVPSE